MTEDVLIFGTLCDIENAHRMEKNWCKLFVPEDFRIIEYFNDLKNFWLRSHGHKTHVYATCNILMDWMNELDNVLNDQVKKYKIPNFWPYIFLMFF
jgi:hypothetical protein